MANKDNDASFDIYQYFGANKEKPIEEIGKRLEKFEEMVNRNPTEESVSVLNRAKKAYYALLEENQNQTEFSDYDPYEDDWEKILLKGRLEEYIKTFDPDEIEKSKQASKRYKVAKEKEKKQAKRVKIKRTAVKIIAGVLVCVCAFGVYHTKRTDNQNNVCVEYSVHEGDTYKKINENFKEYGFSYEEVTDYYRNPEYVYEGDVIIGRTTKEKADMLVAEGYARIISIEEACELLGGNHALIGEFRAFANGDSNMVFYVPDSPAKV